MVRRYLLFGITLILSVVVATLSNVPGVKAGSATPDSVRVGSYQKVKFSHKYHLKEVGAECATCHPAAATSKRASDNLASAHEQCGTCHEEQIANTCGFCHADPENIVSRPVVERTVIFSHEKHLGMKDVACTTCHKGLDETDLAGTRNYPDMATCNTCHNNHKATNTCESCHTDFVTLLPPDHKRSDFLHGHRDVARLGALQTSCQTCHTETFCVQCHQGAGLKSFGGKELKMEPRAKTSTKDSPKRMILQNVHELNYRFTHGIDARAKQSECSSCHVAETFCATCHVAGGNTPQGAFKPKSHMAPGFTTLGRGSGGGVHAEEARRDIESCMSCHNVEGRDPTCMTCHTGSGAVR